MASKLEQICAEMRRLASEAEAMAHAAANHAQRVEADSRRIEALVEGSVRARPLVATLRQASRALRESAVTPLLNAARLNREIAAGLCGGGAGATFDGGRRLPLTVVTRPDGAAARGGRAAAPGGVVLDKVGAPHGGNGGRADHPVPPARAPIEDVSRERIDQLLDEGVKRPEDLPQALVDLRREWIDAGGHGCLRHDHRIIGDQALRDRCTKGHDPITGSRTDWEHGGYHKYSRDASAFRSSAALVFAEAKVWASRDARIARAAADADSLLVHRVACGAESVLGLGFRTYLCGYERLGSKKNPTGSAPISYPRDTKIFAVYERDSLGSPWYVHTIFPKRPPS